MNAEGKSKGSITLALNDEEADELLRLVEAALGETRVEVHRTHTPSYRERVQHSEKILRDVLVKLRQVCG